MFGHFYNKVMEKSVRKPVLYVVIQHCKQGEEQTIVCSVTRVHFVTQKAREILASCCYYNANQLSSGAGGNRRPALVTHAAPRNLRRSLAVAAELKPCHRQFPSACSVSSA